MVGKEGLEPTRLSALDPKSSSSTNSDTSPTEVNYTLGVLIKGSNLWNSPMFPTVIKAVGNFLSDNLRRGNEYNSNHSVRSSGFFA